MRHCVSDHQDDAIGPGFPEPPLGLPGPHRARSTTAAFPRRGATDYRGAAPRVWRGKSGGSRRLMVLARARDSLLGFSLTPCRQTPTLTQSTVHTVCTHDPDAGDHSRPQRFLFLPISTFWGPNRGGLV